MAYFKYNNKSIYYHEVGSGSPLILLHGNTASSKMFDDVINLYSNNFKVIVIDFLGHGRSDRLTSFPVDFWYDEALQVIELIERNECKKVNLIGTSGGALVALNVALERGNLVNKVIADSFEGEQALDIVAQIIEEDRSQSKQNKESIDFWLANHGNDWEKVVDSDTKVMLQHYVEIKHFYHKPLSEITVPTMLTFSMKDEFIEFVDLENIYSDMKNKISNCTLQIFQNGGHPTMTTNAKKFSDKAIEFLID